MRMRSAAVAAVGAAVLMVTGVTACTGPPAEPVASDAPTKTPREPAFASLDEAFDAAVGVLDRYNELSNQIGGEGGIDPRRLLEVVQVGEWADEEIATFEDFERRGIRVDGAASFTKTRLMQYQDVSALIQLYACLDVSHTRIRDRDGSDITPDRDEVVPMMVTFTIAPPSSVLIEKAEVWDRPGIC